MRGVPAVIWPAMRTVFPGYKDHGPKEHRERPEDARDDQEDRPDKDIGPRDGGSVLLVERGYREDLGSGAAAIRMNAATLSGAPAALTAAIALSAESRSRGS